MLSLTRKADYAIVAMAELARRGENLVSAREIAEATQVPLPMLTNILHQLLRGGLVRSAMGSKGGYSLARSPAQISLADLIDAIEGPFHLTICCCGEDAEPDHETCDLEDNCQVREPLMRVHASLRHFLGQVSLAHIVYDDVPVGLNISIGGTTRQHQPAAAIE